MNSIIRLVKKAQEGNDKAFLKIFQKYEKDIFRMAFVYVNNTEDALDVVQEVAYQSFKKIKTLKQPERFKNWLFSITIHCSIDLIRKNKGVVRFNPNYNQFLQVNNIEPDIPLSLTLQTLINNLKEEEKNIVLLKYFNEFTFQEISDLINLPVGTVKSILYRALDKLKGAYSKGERINE